MGNEAIPLVDYITQIKSEGATDSDVKKSFSLFIDRAARKNRIPLKGEFELTPLCNLDCKMCYVHLNSTEFGKDDLIPVSVWKQIMQDAHNAGMLYSTLTGGECLTYPGFDEVYLFLYSIGIVPCILSNGILLDEERISFFKRYPPYRMQITLYGSSNDAYEKVTGHKAFDIVYRNLELLRESGLNVSLALTPSLFIKDDLRGLQEVARSLEIPFGINASLITPRENTGRELQDLDIEDYIEIYRIWKEMRKEELIPIDPVELPDENRYGNPRYGLLCGAGRSSFNIQYNGKMAPCPSLSEITTEPLTDGFLNAWKQLNALVDEYPMPVECPDCVYHDYCFHCPAIHNNAHNPGHCDPRVCERTKRLIQEGFIKFQPI